jgi:hypothetical protein
MPAANSRTRTAPTIRCTLSTLSMHNIMRAPNARGNLI